ncbi:mechanosensitive ion channel family protein [Dyella telluris]|uniref:Small-conductance mechanosensitive channel n=1 Tax=Dyella telluris TaxID=2763498 RepID=A0A7G8Q2C6_9GAMM|nr:mechanosensitive ion channel family protein [Dyella telluris]QNK00934.1 mechanosensitive ion channel family protein [Dyella telluris]
MESTRNGWSRLVTLWQVAALLLLWTMAPMQAHADQSPPTATPSAPKPTASSPEATLRYFNRDIVTFRADFLGRSPELRAAAGAANIDRISAHSHADQVTFNDVPQGMLVMLDNEFVCIITPDDLDTLNSETMASVRARVSQTLTEAVQASDDSNSPKRLIQAVSWSALATLIVATFLLMLRWLGRHIDSALQRWLERRLLAIRNESARQFALSTRMIASWILRVVIWIVGLAAFAAWVRFVLAQFPYTQPWARVMRGWVLGTLRHWGESIADALPGIVTAIVILLVARVIAQAVSITFRGVQSGRFKLLAIDSELAEPTRKIVVAVIWLFAVAMAYPYLPGAQTEAFKGLSVLVGLMVSLGASGIIGQAAAGFTILYARTMKVGDVIKSGNTEGAVLQIGMFTTRLRTLTGVEVSIPNNVVLASQLQNYSRNPEGPGMWLTTTVTIGYDAPWRQVQQMLVDAAKATAHVHADPAPFVLQTALSDFYVEYLLHARIADNSLRLDILHELHSRIQDNFNTAGVQIMSPHYVGDPKEAKVVPPDHWNG